MSPSNRLRRVRRARLYSGNAPVGHRRQRGTTGTAGRRPKTPKPTATNGTGDSEPGPVEPRSRLQRSPSRSYPFLYERFHVLLNSLFKVLCNFPSRYLLAIGLAAVFQLVLEGVYLPLWAALSSNPTLGETTLPAEAPVAGHDRTRRTELSSSTDIGPDQRDSNACDAGIASVSLTSHRSDTTTVVRMLSFDAGLFPVHSPLLGKSSLVSFPPPNYMLKFSG